MIHKYLIYTSSLTQILSLKLHLGFKQSAHNFYYYLFLHGILKWVKKKSENAELKKIFSMLFIFLYFLYI